MRWLIVAALLLGAAVWYSWTAHRSPERPMVEVFVPPPTSEPEVTSSAVEVQPSSAESQP